MTTILLIYAFSAICVAVLVNATELDSMYNCDKAVFILTPVLNTGVMLVAAYYGFLYLIKSFKS